MIEKRYLVTADEMRQYDYNTIEKNQIPQLVLMERAAMAVVSQVMKHLEKKGKILIAAGNGNNGADAVACGRILREYGYEVSIFLVPDDRVQNQALKAQLTMAEPLQIKILSELVYKDYDLAIDGVFGIGLNREITGAYYKAVDALNHLNCFTISVDIPSGIDATDGHIYGIAVSADLTVTFGFFKRGLFLGNGRQYAGKIECAKIGINETSFYGTIPGMFTYYDNMGEDKIDLLRKKDGNKGDFGKVAIIAGNRESAGAAMLCAGSAFRSGCGMVMLLSDAENKSTFLNALPEVIFKETDSEKEGLLQNSVAAAAKWADVLAAGPAIGTDEHGLALMSKLVEQNKPLIIDADGITLLARHEALSKKLLDRQLDGTKQHGLIFTPHLKELSCLAGKTIQETKADVLNTALFVAKKYHAVVIAKDAVTIVCDWEDRAYAQTTINDAMATAGSGDVLTGLCASVVAQYLKKDVIPYEKNEKSGTLFYAGVMAVYIHGAAGASAEEKQGRSYTLAGDLIKQYRYVMQ